MLGTQRSVRLGPHWITQRHLPAVDLAYGDGEGGHESGPAMVPSGAPAADAERASSVGPGIRLHRGLRAPRGALTYRPRSGHGLEEVSVGLMAYLDP